MNEYTFEELSPMRFEKLARDILKKQYGKFENFAEGKDSGIDFRYSFSDGSFLIVQCKKYKEFKNLKSSLKRELSKLENLNFSQYIIVTSLDLNPSQKDLIQKEFHKYINNPNEIITRGDLNEIIQDDKSIIYEYPELWMKSINIHQKIFNIGILKHADFIKEILSQTLINFVATEDYHNIINHYKNNNVLIISGNPGVGKSTLAYAALSNFVFHQEYKLIDLTSRKIQDAEQFLMNEEPTIFLIDDFLGQIRLEKNEDFGRLLSFFIEKIEKSSNKKLIITTRGYILEAGIKNLSSVNNINNIIEKYTIELKLLKRSSRTEILYNHLKNSEIEIQYLNNLLKNDYKKIIDHKNFNPRVINHLTKNNFIKRLNILPDDYFNYFIQNLENPSEIWKQFYENLPNDFYKLIIINRFLINDKTPYERLEKAIMSFVQNCPQFQSYSLDYFEQVIRELNGTIFIIDDGYDEMVDENFKVIDFHNPSIIDFLNNHIWKNKYWLKIIIENAIYFEQLFNWDLTDIIKENDELLLAFKNKIIKDFNKLENVGFGFFEYNVPDGDIVTSWKGERRFYFLQEFISLFDIKVDIGLQNFVKKELFRYPIDGAEDTSEKIAYAQICESFLHENLIDDKMVILNYTNGFFNDIKELVYLEYLLRYCSKECLKIVKSNKGLVETADILFLWEFENINEEMHYVDLIDLLDDYQQIKKILPLTKSTKLLKKIKINEKLNSSYMNLGKKENFMEDEIMEYSDIDSKEIENLFKSLKQ